MVAMEKKRKIKVIKTIKKTDYLKKSKRRALIKIKDKDEGVLGLIANTRLYSYEYEPSYKLECSSPHNHKNYFNSFSDKINSLNGFEFNVARRYITDSIKKNDDSYLILSALLSSNTERANRLVQFLHMNLIDREIKDFCMMRYNLIDYVINSNPNPKDLTSDNLYSFLLIKKKQIYLNNQFIFFQ
jgi:hypothetical protein